MSRSVNYFYGSTKKTPIYIKIDPLKITSEIYPNQLSLYSYIGYSEGVRSKSDLTIITNRHPNYEISLLRCVKFTI